MDLSSDISKGSYSGRSTKTFAIMLRDLEVIYVFVRYPAPPRYCSRPAQGGVRALIMLLGPTVSLTHNEWAP